MGKSILDQVLTPELLQALQGKDAQQQDDLEPPEEGHSRQRDLLTDLGNCQRFVQQHHRDLRYCPGLGWLIWDGKRWARDEDGSVMRRAKQTALRLYDEAKEELRRAIESLTLAQVAAATGGSAAKDAQDKLAKVHKAALRRLAWAEQSQSRYRLEAMVALAQSESALVVRVGDLDRDPMLFNCNNGTVDLRTGHLTPHRREDLITRLAPVDFDPNARHPVWESYLAEATGGDGDLAAYLQRWAGYCLTGNTGEEQVALLLGPAATGKTTFVEALSAAMGDYALKAPFDTFLERSYSNPGAPRPDLARLPGVRLVTAVEASAQAGLDAVLLKELSGGDTLTVRTVYKEPFTFKPQCKVVLASNEAPRVSDRDTGVWRRLRRLPFECVVPEGKRDPRVKAVLTDPATGGPAVLAWAVRGCLEWQQHGLGRCEAVERKTAELRAEMDPLAAFFEDCCVFGPAYEVAAKTLREVYETWCRENGIKAPVDNTEWGQRLEGKGCKKAQGRRCGVKVKLWRGIGLAAEREDEPEGGTDGTDGTDVQGKLPIGKPDLPRRKVHCTSVPSVPPDREDEPEAAPAGQQEPGKPCSACGEHDWVWSAARGAYLCGGCGREHIPATATVEGIPTGKAQIDRTRLQELLDKGVPMREARERARLDLAPGCDGPG